MSILGVQWLERVDARVLSMMSSEALDRPLQYDAEIVIAQPADDALVLGALQRLSEVHALAGPVLRRGSGGAETLVGPGTLWLQLSLAHPSVLVRCDPSRLLNRHVRPLLRALAKVGALTHYFDRDWLSAQKRPVGMVAFAHDATTGRSLVEAIVAVSTPFALRQRPSYLGKEPTTLGSSVTIAHLADLTFAAYTEAYGRTVQPLGLPLPPPPVAPLIAEPPWTVTREEAIGTLGAGRDRQGRLRLGGELMVSRDALARLEACLPDVAPTAEALGALVDDTLGAPGVALLGVRSLLSVRDLLLAAL